VDWFDVLVRDFSGYATDLQGKPAATDAQAAWALASIRCPAADPQAPPASGPGRGAVRRLPDAALNQQPGRAASQPARRIRLSGSLRPGTGPSCGQRIRSVYEW
jgi:hypothetical protein